MARITLTAARVTALRPRKSAYDTRDSKLTGFGVRVLPSGRKRFFIHCQHRGERVWRVVGDANSMSVADARRHADEMLAAIRRGEDATPHPGNTLARRDRPLGPPGRAPDHRLSGGAARIVGIGQTCACRVLNARCRETALRDVRARIDEKIREEAAAVLNTISLTVSDTFRLMMVRIATDKRLPFDPLVPNEEPSPPCRPSSAENWSPSVTSMA